MYIAGKKGGIAQNRNSQSDVHRHLIQDQESRRIRCMHLNLYRKGCIENCFAMERAKTGCRHRASSTRRCPSCNGTGNSSLLKLDRH